MKDTDVLVVGSGPVGLALAIELGIRGIRVMLVERNARGGSAPRAKTTNVRTRTHLRRWGLAEELAAASPLGIDYPNDIMFVTRLAEHALAHIPNAFNAAPSVSTLYPEHAQWIPQYTLEQVLRKHAQRLASVDLQFGTAFCGAAQNSESVTSTVQDDHGKTREITSRFLVGADGSRSTVRGVIGAKMEGVFGLSRNYNVVFRAPGLKDAHRHPQAVMYWHVNRDGASLIGPMDRDDIWFFMPTGMKEGEKLTNVEAAAAIVKATGIDLPYEILSTDEWTASSLVADRYRSGRIFLAGDACHLHPPFGGYGMNMGIGDGVDLGWKLAAVLEGWGGPALLDSYEIERRTVHEIVIREAVANHAVLGGQLWKEGLEDDTPQGAFLRHAAGQRIIATKTREFKTLGTVLGLGYTHSPIIEFENAPAPAHSGEVYSPTARPGHLAPHAWLPDGRSLYDLFGTGFTLIASEAASEAELVAAQKATQAINVPLTIVRPFGVPVRELYKADLVLIRPDQHVAWRGDKWQTAVFKKVIGESTILNTERRVHS